VSDLRIECILLGRAGRDAGGTNGDCNGAIARVACAAVPARGHGVPCPYGNARGAGRRPAAPRAKAKAKSKEPAGMPAVRTATERLRCGGAFAEVGLDEVDGEAYGHG